ncbi:MAG: hypothetical protein U1A25_02540 [Candidatus Sungbacteria bacterium]|nr:hypothetical protein [bacterium]MDZ4260519.1 hypothetical protein [Candidatus Sungbacteria bacterium]
MRLLKAIYSLYRKIISHTGEFCCIQKDMRMALVVVLIIIQLGIAGAVRADYHMSRIDTFARVINAPINLTASIFDSVRNFLHIISGGRIGGAAIALDVRAIRDKNRGTPVSATEGTSTPASVNIHAPAGFKQSVEFTNGFTSQSSVIINGLLTSQEINVGAGNITASNILYGLTAGEGIEITGESQRPTITATNIIWKQEGTTVTTRDPALSLAIGGTLTLGATTTGSTLQFLGTSTIVFDSYAITTIAKNLANAWGISTSATDTPIINIDTRDKGTVAINAGEVAINAGNIAINAPLSSQKINIKNSQLGSIAFQITETQGQTG